jgi:osmotically-inducible protein OsmY
LLAAACTAGGERSTIEVEDVSAAEPPPPAAPPSPVPPPRTVEEAARAARRTHDVVSALMAETTLDANAIEVASDEAGGVVVLRGSVPSTLQRELAERLARQNAGGYEVRTELVIAP